jgi:hypothetical protein
MAMNLFPKLQAATKKAFQRVHKVGNVESDPDLALYNTLNENNFTELMKEYGEDTVIAYIRDMESKRIMQGRKK